MSYKETLDGIKGVTSCGNCGDGFFNSCSKKECEEIGQELEKQCVWTQSAGWWFGECKEAS